MLEQSPGTIATLSGEAECYGMAKACAEAVWMQFLARDLGVEMGITLHIGSSAAMAIGRVRHLQVRYFWVQARANRKHVGIKKVGTNYNVAAVLTPPLLHALTVALIARAGVHDVESYGALDDSIDLIVGGVEVSAFRYPSMHDTCSELRPCRGWGWNPNTCR